MPAQLPSSGGTDACPGQASFNPTNKCDQAAVRFQEVCRKRMRPCGQGLTHLQVLGSQPSGTSAHFSTSAVTSQVIKVLQEMNFLKPCAPSPFNYKHFITGRRIPPSSFLSRSPQDFHPDMYGSVVLCTGRGRARHTAWIRLFTEDINFTHDSLLVWIIEKQRGEVVDRIVCIGWRDIH